MAQKASRPASLRASRPVGRRVRPADSDARGRLLDAAITLFAERGIANTTVAQIGAAGQVTSAMVHYWFDTRERLLDAIVDERLAPLFHYIWDSVDAERGAPIELVERIVGRMFEVTGKSPWLPSLWVREIVNEGGLLRERALRRIPPRVLAFAQALARGKRRGVLNADIEPALVFISILALVMLPQAAAKIWERVHPTLKFERAGLERHVHALLMTGLVGTALGRSTASSKRSKR